MNSESPLTWITFEQWFSAIYAGLVGALYWCLLVNGFVGFQWAEDGTPMSLWVRSPCPPAASFTN